MKDIFIIVPTLNPNTQIFEAFLDKLQKKFTNILVYDDGCRKEYKPFFQDLEKRKITVLHHYINLGKGRAMKDAFNYLLNTYPNLKGVVTADSDGQHGVKDIEKVAKAVLDHPDSLILGCRNFNSENVPKRNRFGNKITRNVMKAFVGLSVTDTQTGLRGLSKDMMMAFMTTPGDRFEYETNQLIETLNKNIPIYEVEIETIYLENSNSESHFNPLKDSIAIYKLFLKYIVASLSSFIIDIILFALFCKVIPGSQSILISTIIARVLSSIYNFTINAKVVFKSKSASSFIKYAILCLIMMFVSGYSVQGLYKLLKINKVVLKLIVDLVIFIINFVIQREFIFVEKKNEK